MALFRGFRRRLRQANPCTMALVVTFLASVFYLISAIRSNYFQPSPAAALLSGVGLGIGGLSASQHTREESFIVGDDEIQLCKMTSGWALSAVEQQDQPHQRDPSAEARRLPNPCKSAADTLPTLFYIDADGTLAYNDTATADVVEDSCAAWKIEWYVDTGYVKKNISLSSELDSDFIHVRCRLRHNVDDERGVESIMARPPRRRRRSHRTTSLSTAEQRARQMHRDQLRRFSPNFAGNVGLPDPLGHVIGQKKSPDPEKNEVRARRGGKSSGFASRARVDRKHPSEPSKTRQLQGSAVDAEILSRPGRDLNHQREDGSSTQQIYEQWIARIHPLSEVVDREASDDDGSRHSVRRLNVLVLALESMSSLSFDTELPRSHKILIEQPNTVLFTGYNVIGDAAPANIIPLLTGTSSLIICVLRTLFCHKASPYAPQYHVV